MFLAMYVWCFVFSLRILSVMCCTRFYNVYSCLNDGFLMCIYNGRLSGTSKSGITFFLLYFLTNPSCVKGDVMGHFAPWL